MKQLGVILLVLVLAAVLYVGGMLFLGWVTKFKPEPLEKVEVISPQNQSYASPKAISDSTVSLMIWNVGYGGLGAEVDFFYDGGKMVTSPQEHVAKNNEGMKTFLAQHSDVDFFLFQEVDRKGKRSHETDQAENFAKVLSNHQYAFTPNYDVLYLPFPFTDPMGRVYGGLQSLSKYASTENLRIALPGITDFPRKLFYLERCLLLQRFPVANGKELIVINAHFEAYDDGGIKKQQMEVAKKFMDEEFAKGNYVIMGGDWNIAPATFNVKTWEKEPESDALYLKNNDPNYMAGWQVAYDFTVATNRKNKTAFDANKTFTTVIDYYLVSPNLEVQSVNGMDLKFAFSDHQPVKLKVRFK
jgi:endonuclease/exonuclease/phosphatase family metal-dependent hydrolase